MAEGDDISLLLKYFPLTETQKAQFTELGRLYHDWNQKINLISRKDMEHLYEHHILHSLAIAKLIQFKPRTRIVDVGTGGGLPGVPLAIFFPECEFLLVDSIGKKIMVVQDLIKQLGLDNAKARQARAEELHGKADFVTGRAVTDIQEFHKNVNHLIGDRSTNELANGIIYLKGGDLKKELGKLAGKTRITPISKWFTEDYFESKMVVYINTTT